MAIQQNISLGARHLRIIPKAASLLDLLVRVTNQAVRAYSSNEDMPAVHFDNPDFFRFDSETIIRFIPFMSADYPNPFGGGNYGEEWTTYVNEALILDFDGVASPDDYVDRQVSVIRKWIERMTPQVALEPAPVQNRKVALLQEQIDAALGDHPADFTKWRERSETALRVALGQDHPLVSTFAKLRFSPVVISADTSSEVFATSRRTGVKRGVAILESAVLEMDMREDGSDEESTEEAVESMNSVVFIVHGHDTKTLSEAVLAINRLTGEEAIVLHDQPNRGQTIIEKFERHASDAGFVVVLATADDVGRAKDAEILQTRARQNVVFELGYFIGALGRDKVAVLYDEEVELPSDMDGVLYIRNDAGGAWRLKLAKEMRAAGLDADTNRL